MNEDEKRIAKQRVVARLTLEATRKFMPSAIIAGGAPRNWYCGRPAKDIDIFLMQDFDGNLDKVIYTMKRSPDDLVQVKGKDREEKVETSIEDSLSRLGAEPKPKHEYVTRSIFEVWELYHRGENIQWIFISKKAAACATQFVQESFDFEICKFYFDGIEITAEDEAFTDVEQKTLTFSVSHLEEIGRLSTLAKRAAKLQHYFPDHKIRIKE